MAAQEWWPYVWGALGGIGVLLVYYGLKRVREAKRPDPERRQGLWMVNAGIVCLAASMALAIWVK
jgi:tetrahydromethanopterin S-methyltransferase subunit D